MARNGKRVEPRACASGPIPSVEALRRAASFKVPTCGGSASGHTAHHDGKPPTVGKVETSRDTDTREHLRG